MKTVADVLKSTQVITVSAAAPLHDVVSLFEEKLISGAPVVDDEGRMVGIVTRTDVISRLFREGSITSTRVQDVMTPFVFRVTPHDPLTRLLEIMLSARIHRVVVTLDERPVGMVTTLDLLAGYQALLEAECPA